MVKWAEHWGTGPIREASQIKEVIGGKGSVSRAPEKFSLPFQKQKPNGYSPKSQSDKLSVFTQFRFPLPIYSSVHHLYYREFFCLAWIPPPWLLSTATRRILAGMRLGICGSSRGSGTSRSENWSFERAPCVHGFRFRSRRERLQRLSLSLSEINLLGSF